ncbi:thioredoxin [Escherichia phage P479]|nr:thioredoxin [Escherichia phage P479]
MSQAINEIRSEVKKVVKFNSIPSTKDVVLKVLYMMWDKFNVCTNSAEFTKIFNKTTGLLTLEDRVMKSLHRSGMLSRANAKILLKNYNKGYDLYGRAISTMTFDEVVKDLWKNQRRLLALGARLASGQDKQMTFKTNNSLDYKLFNVIKGQNEGEYSISSFSGCQYENWKFHLRLALSVLECHGVLTFYDVQTGGVQRIKLCQIKDQVEVSPSEQAPKMEPVPVRSNEKYSEQIELFTKQIEELNITIQQQDDEIFRLSGLNGAAKAERQKLMDVIKLLKA